MDFVPIKEDDYEVDFEVGNEIPSIDKGEYDQEGDSDDEEESDDSDEETENIF